MIMAQERAVLKSRRELSALWSLVERAGAEGWRVDQVERELFAALLQLGRTLLGAFVAQAGDGDEGERVEQGERVVRRSEVKRPRRYVSIFGELVIERYVYAARAGQRAEYLPLDAQLGLPADDFSYVLVDWQQRMCLKDSFAEAVTSLGDLLGVAPSVRAAEHGNRHLAEHAEAFRLAQGPPDAAEEGEVLVLTADGKGVPMRRPIEERVRRGPRRAKGEKANKKQMAYVAAVYSIAPFVRTADDVVDEVLRRERAADRPRPQHKRVWAEMTRIDQGAVCTGKERLFAEAAIDLHERDGDRRKTVVCLMDGEAGLWAVQREWVPRAVGVLDVFHVLERLWGVAHCLHRESSPEAEAFVAQQLRLLLEGKVGYVIGGLRRLIDKHRLVGQRCNTVRSAITYYENNRDHMRYDKYLAAGYPIGSGVAEGACRHLVKDRLERTGMRWTTHGAQSLLHLRAIYLNGDWQTYLESHIQNEQATLYAQLAA
jgi:hypothetical protein